MSNKNQYIETFSFKIPETYVDNIHKHAQT